MTNLTAPISSTYNGLFWNAVDSRMEMYYRGTKVTHVSATELQVDQALDVDGAANFAAEAEFVANVDIQLTLEVSDGVGSDGEQLTSGGGGAVCDWSLSGV